MIEQDLGRIATALERIADVLEKPIVKEEKVIVPLAKEEPPLAAEKFMAPEVEEVSDDEMEEEKKKIVENEPEVEKPEAPKEEPAKPAKSSNPERQMYIDELKKRGIGVSTKWGTAALKRRYDSVMAEETRAKEVVEPEVVNEMPEELQEQKEAEEGPKETHVKKTVKEEPEEEVTLDDVKAILIQYSRDFGRSAAEEILTDGFGISKLSQLSENKYGDMIEKVGAEIKRQNEIANDSMFG